jgi:hypothetical protein
MRVSVAALGGPPQNTPMLWEERLSLKPDRLLVRLRPVNGCSAHCEGSVISLISFASRHGGPRDAANYLGRYVQRRGAFPFSKRPVAMTLLLSS